MGSGFPVRPGPTHAQLSNSESAVIRRTGKRSELGVDLQKTKMQFGICGARFFITNHLGSRVADKCVACDTFCVSGGSYFMSVSRCFPYVV